MRSLSFCHGSYLQLGLSLMYRVGVLCSEADAACFPSAMAPRIRRISIVALLVVPLL